MNHRLNSAIHLVSACYWTAATMIGFLLGSYPSHSLLEFRGWVIAGLGLAGVDLLAAVKQWRSEAAGRVLSIVLHFAVAVLVTALITFEYVQTGPKSFVKWFRMDNYSFIAGLAIVRLCSGNALLLGNKDTH